MRRFSAHDKDGGRVFHGPAKPIPMGQRDAVQHSHRGFAEVEQHHSKASGMQKKIHGSHGMFGISAAAHPQEALERHARCMGGSGMKTVVNIDDCTDLASCGGLRQDVQVQRGSTGRPRTVDFSNYAPR